MSSLANRLSIRDVNLNGKKVFMRVDFNVPIQDGKIKSLQRILMTIPTIEYALSNGASAIILASHLGRANGKVNKDLSLKPVAAALESLLKKPVEFLDDCVGDKVKDACQKASGGKIILLENLRFHSEEEKSYKNSNGEKVSVPKNQIEEFSASLTKLGDIYVNDAFGTSHRAHTSIVGVNVPLRACGFLMEKELKSFSKVLESPERPILAILGGAKISDKIPLIENLLGKVSGCIVFGGMSYTFLKAKNHGFKVGNSIFDEAGYQLIPKILEKAKKNNVEIYTPVDFVIADKLDESAQTKVCTLEDGIPDGWMGLDIGEKTCNLIKDVVGKYKTIVWNGPAGVFEIKKFCHGTEKVLEYVSNCTKNGATTIIGGGDTASAALSFAESKNLEFTHISTGGGASLELLEGKKLPGVEALSTK